MSKHARALVAGLAVLMLISVACGGKAKTTASGTPTGGATTSANDLLAAIMKAGVLRVSTDPAYPPQSSLNEKTGKWEGFDIDVATEIAKRLGVKIDWKTPAWDTITSGHWNGRWDLSVGSMTVTPERAQVLDFTTPYYFTPAGVAVHKDNTTFTDPSQLSGKKIGVCGDCTYEKYLEGTLQIPGVTIAYKIDNADIHTYDTDTTAIEDLSLGDGVRLDAVMSAVPTLQQAIKDGKPIKLLGEPLFFEPLAAAIDKSSSLDPNSLVQKVSQIIEDMHNDGTLTSLSMKWYGEDLTVQT
jgi:polar amino acid transport system substrate-binding protein